MQLHPHYSSSFDETDIRSIADKWLIEADQLQLCPVHTKIHIADTRPIHISWILFLNVCKFQHSHDDTDTRMMKRVSLYYFLCIFQKQYSDTFLYEGDCFCTRRNVSVHMRATV